MWNFPSILVYVTAGLFTISLIPLNLAKSCGGPGLASCHVLIDAWLNTKRLYARLVRPTRRHSPGRARETRVIYRKAGNMNTDFRRDGKSMHVSDFRICPECNKIMHYCQCSPAIEVPWKEVTPEPPKEDQKLLAAPKRTYLLFDTQDTLISRFMNHLGWEEVRDYRSADAVVFPGGADVTANLYGDIAHPLTRNNEKMDNRWMSFYGHIKSNKWLKIGICRGAQFLNVMNGGKMWQDCDGHATGKLHECVYYAKNGEKLVFDVTSTHHQMMLPNHNWAELWGDACESSYRDLGTDRRKEKENKSDRDPEVLYYPNTRTLCFQPHPEYGSESCRQLFQVCLQRALLRSGEDDKFMTRASVH